MEKGRAGALSILEVISASCWGLKLDYMLGTKAKEIWI